MLAQASPRPRACLPARDAGESRLWALARGEASSRYCRTLGRGYARLETRPEEALSLARAAHAMVQGDVEARVLAGRALARLARWSEAYQELSQSALSPGRPFGDVAALRELGVSASMTSHVNQAVSAYRALVPRATFSHDRVFSRIALIEAAVACLGLGPAGLSEAELYLVEARRRAVVPGLEDLTVALLSLVLDRSDRSPQAQALLGEMAGPWALERFQSARDSAESASTALEDVPFEPTKLGPLSPKQPMLPEGVLHAAIGVAAQGTDPVLARAHLQAFLAGPGGKGPWASWGRSKLGR